jgi:hypothetical protein
MSAVISPCGKYRYRLQREIGQGWKIAVFVMLNPSTADAEQDDPTIRRCIGFAKAWGCGQLIVVNLFAVRATDPKVMLAADDPVGPDNYKHVKRAVRLASRTDPETSEPEGIVVCAWGAHGSYMDQDETTLSWIERECAVPHALKLTKDRMPSHPLYLRTDTKPFKYLGRRHHG